MGVVLVRGGSGRLPGLPRRTRVQVVAQRDEEDPLEALLRRKREREERPA